MTKYTAQQVFSIVSKNKLTEEQSAAISDASTDGPSLVIAGAGSGKTELMAVRTLFLVANGLAKPSEILGLTFTRKAASELSNRVNKGLVELRESSFWPEGLAEDFEPPKIITYNSFGNEIFRTLSLQVGFEADATLLTEAGAIALAKDIVTGATAEDFAELLNWDRTLDYLTEKVLSASAALTDNRQAPETAINYLRNFQERIAGLPKTDKGEAGTFAYHQAVIDTVRSSSLVFELANKYQEEKRIRGLVDFSDQVALAFTALEKQELLLPHRFVLLDEYQDTSSIQTMLLAKLFRGRAVMAVGDPNQAIYGWRGASSANLSGYSNDFGKAEQFALSASWRSGQKIVDAANLVSEPLSSDVGLTPVRLTAGLAIESSVQALVCQDEVSEAKAAAEWLESRMSEDTSGAILFRSKQAMSVFTEALAARGLDFEVSGLSGLLEQPEVIDLIAALKVISDPESGAELMRILAGPKFRIAPRDIAKLQSFAKKLSRMRKEVNGQLPMTLVETLDELRNPKTHEMTEVSEFGLQRMVFAADLFHRMRTQLSLGVSEFAWAVAKELELDIELYAHSNAKFPLANLEGFISRISDYEATAIRPSLNGLISWLNYAVTSERFELPKTGTKAGVVQLMSVHAAKGLEWDLVVVAGLVNGSFPVESRETKGWLSLGKLPNPLRQDSAWIPTFTWESATTQKELKTALDQFADENRAKHEIEERRLAYVAVTRASKQLLLTASYYKAGNLKPRLPAAYLEELLDADLVELVSPIPEPDATNPLSEASTQAVWPLDPLGDSRPVYLSAAKAVETAKPLSAAENLQLAALVQQTEVLGQNLPPEIPLRLSASRVVSLLADPENFLSELERPLPVAYSEAAAQGTIFHEALERAFELDGEIDAELFADEDQHLAEQFLKSRFATLQPVFVEKSLEYELGGTIVVCKLDAVFETDQGFEIVDWKSGASPKSKAEIEAKAIQLALYRIGLARLLGVGIERVTASFFFAKDGVEISPQVTSEANLSKQLASLRKARLQS